MQDQPIERDKRYADWLEVYIDEVRNRVKHWGDKRKRGGSVSSPRAGDLDAALFLPGGQDA